MGVPRLAASLFVLAAACGAPSPTAKETAPAPKVDGPITVAEWKQLCEAQAERARRCPGPAPEALDACTKRGACFAGLVRGEVLRSLAKCQSQNDCTRPCSIDRVTATLPATSANVDLEEACVKRRSLCPSIDCNAIVRPVRPLDAEATAPLVECLNFEKSCLDVAACVLEKMTPVIARVTACGTDAPRGDAGADAR
jgi:hypothetical protein